MTIEKTEDINNESSFSVTATVFLIRFFLIFFIVGICGALGKLFYGLTDASKESIAQAAKDECMKANILAYRAENGAINKSTLWDYERGCKLKRQYQNQIQLIKHE